MRRFIFPIGTLIHSMIVARKIFLKTIDFFVYIISVYIFLSFCKKKKNDKNVDSLKILTCDHIISNKLIN